MSPFEALVEKGFFLNSLSYSPKLIEEWNMLLSPLFIVQEDKGRAYVKANVLFELGILDKIFNEQIQSLLCHLMPDAIFYHCHAYEIKASQAQSHIHWGENLGWHRDEECAFEYNPKGANHISMFIYLTDVDEENGPFEIRLASPFSYFKPKEKTLKVIDKAGAVFFFNRFFWHRACPNYSSSRRRVIKFSFQPRGLNNGRINLTEFVELRKLAAPKNVFLEYLANPDHPAKSLQEIISQPSLCEPYPSVIIPSFNSSMDLGLKYILKHNWKLLKQKLKKNSLETELLPSKNY